ncbi:hypothetical protein IF188_06530 [Microbacterium sp. NEAU-LLC]|uniref:HTH luxR-type domain-containing protein n=1 Tax=Microbacterium helvum TaxID=2773713 RepID=A0ABR8NMF7_9MICO|nr:LuxR family transcriptional regulator [Microbacterium helvum]MBD3941354.1 hypothetical protein [Microbacterium helvum]
MFPATKFRPPVSAVHALARDRLLGPIAADASVIVVRAPAGFGKTTAVAQWLAASRARSAIWVSLDEDDDDPQGLWAAIAAGAASMGLTDAGRQGRPAAGELRAEVIVPLIDVLAADPRRWTLVLDDAHLLTREDTVASLDWFLRRIPAGLTVLCITRSPLDLPAIARLRARGAAREIGTADLRLSLDEIAALLHGAHGLDPDRAELDRIADVTGGWPAAVSLVGSALARGLTWDRILAQHVDDELGIGALVGEVLADGDPADADLLRRMSVFERFTAAIVAEVVDDARAWGVAMDVAERTGLVATLDGTWWRMHHLVREQLHAELGRREPRLRRELHRRAAAVFERENDLTATMHHLLAAEDYTAVADILSNVRTTAVVPRQALGLGWLDRIPASALDRDPRLAFWEAWATGTGGDRARRDRALARGRLAAGGRPVDAFCTWDDAEDFVRGSACFDDVGAALRAGDRFVERYSADEPYVQLAQLRRASMMHLAGRDRDALALLDDLDRGAPLARPLRLFVPAYRALSAMELGDLATAEMQLQRCADARRDFQIGADPVYLPAEQARARFETERGAPDRGLEIARAGLQTSRDRGDGVLVVPYLLVEVARARFALGRRDEASIALNQAEEITRGAVDPGALPQRIAALRARFGGDSGIGTAREQLTRRELEVLTLLPSGLSAAEIAAELFVSANTARTHIKAIHRKLGVTTRAAAIDAATRAGLLSARSQP